MTETTSMSLFSLCESLLCTLIWPPSKCSNLTRTLHFVVAYHPLNFAFVLILKPFQFSSKQIELWIKFYFALSLKWEFIEFPFNFNFVKWIRYSCMTSYYWSEHLLTISSLPPEAPVVRVCVRRGVTSTMTSPPSASQTAPPLVTVRPSRPCSGGGPQARR